ncbi:MAG TPA: hypothetical protein VKP30_03385 [Polyangiaceae bacterium]|nr:hypothetical protein [Polyangiaceae bacterium]
MRGLLQSLPIVGIIARLGEPPDAVVSAFWKHMQSHYGTSLVNKLSSVEMNLLSQALDTLGILKKVEFLENFTTTIGRCIYVPFEPGVPRAGWDLWSQVVICVHEHQHVEQQRRLGIEYEARYLADRASRAEFETEALRSNLELAYWRTGKIPSTKALANTLSNYCCSAGDIAVASKQLALSALSIRCGAVLNEASKVALDWLDEHAPNLKAK